MDHLFLEQKSRAVTTLEALYLRSSLCLGTQAGELSKTSNEHRLGSSNRLLQCLRRTCFTLGSVFADLRKLSAVSEDSDYLPRTSPLPVPWGLPRRITAHTTAKLGRRASLHQETVSRGDGTLQHEVMLCFWWCLLFSPSPKGSVQLGAATNM